jgi:hypothetical protein
MGDKLHEALNSDGSHYSWFFRCPGCKAPHQCDSRWTFNGDRERPTFGGSVLVHAVNEIGRPRCHSFVTDGKISFCADSTHAHAGQTLDLPDWDAHTEWW